MAASPNRAIFSEPSIRAYQEWSPDKISTAEITADSGNLRIASDFIEAMLTDDRLSSVLEQRIDSLLGCELVFDAAAGDGRRRKKALRALELEEDFWDSFPESELKQLLTWGILLGVAVAELRWIDKGNRVLPSLEVKHPRHLRFDWSKRAWILTVEVDGVNKDQVVTPGDGKWLLFTPFGASRPWARGAWRGCARWFLLKRYAISDLGRHLEILGGGIFVAESPEGADDADRKRFGDDINDIGPRTAIAPPPGYKLTLVEAKGGAEAAFVAAIAQANTGYTVAIARHNLVAEVQGGSFAAAETGRTISLGTTRYDNQALSTCLHDQGLTWWAEYNFGDPRLAPWPQWNIEPPADLAARAATISAIATAIATLKTSGVPVDATALLEEFGVPVGEEELPPANEPPKVPDALVSVGAFTANEVRAGEGFAPTAWGNDPLGGAAPSFFSSDSAMSPAPSPAATPPSRALLAAESTQSAPRIPRRGGLEGQLYADTVATKSSREAGAAMRPTLAAALSALDVGDDDDDLKEHADAIRASLLAAYRKSPTPDALASLVAGAGVVAGLAGRAAVEEDRKDEP